jgi:hypothetical protein
MLQRIFIVVSFGAQKQHLSIFIKHISINNWKEDERNYLSFIEVPDGCFFLAFIVWEFEAATEHFTIIQIRSKTSHRNECKLRQTWVITSKLCRKNLFHLQHKDSDWKFIYFTPMHKEFTQFQPANDTGCLKILR